MTDQVTLLAAFGAGIVSFVSPCVLPIVPGYLTVVTGVDLAGSTERTRQQTVRLVRDTGLFIAGFTLVFVLLGLTATTIGSALFRNQLLLTRVAGVFLLAMALYLVGSLVAKSPWLYQDKRFHPDLSRYGPFAAPVAGVAFGLGWTPCIGPVLTSVLAVAATQEGAGEGALLLGVYSLGLGIPFLVTGLAFHRLAGAFGFVKRHLRGITWASATSLGVFGLLLLTNQLLWVTSRLQDGLRAIGLEELIFLG